MGEKSLETGQSSLSLAIESSTEEKIARDHLRFSIVFMSRFFLLATWFIYSLLPVDRLQEMLGFAPSTHFSLFLRLSIRLSECRVYCHTQAELAGSLLEFISALAHDYSIIFNNMPDREEE